MKQVTIAEALQMVLEKTRPFIVELEQTLQLDAGEKERLENLLSSDVETLLMVYTTMSPKLAPFRLADSRTNYQNLKQVAGTEKISKLTFEQWEKIERIVNVIDRLLKDIE